MHDLLNDLNILAFEIAPIFYKLLFMSITAVCIATVILLIRRIGDKKIPPVWKYILWGCGLVALLIPYRPQSDFALIQNTSLIENISYREQYDSIKSELKIAIQSENPNEEEQTTIERLKKQVNITYLQSALFDVALPLIWLLGMTGGFAFFVISRVSLSYKIKINTINSEKYEKLLLECKEKLGIKAEIEVVLQDYITSPALMGVIKPKIILPKFTEDMSEENLFYILMHELAHFKRKDMHLNYLLLALQAIYWFNPLIWVMFKFIREDMELLNDSYLLNRIGEENSKHYARSLVEVLGQSHDISLVPKLLCMVDGKKNVERRIKMIKLGETFKKHKVIVAVACLLIISVVSVLFLTQGNSSGESMKGANNLTADEEKLSAFKGLELYIWKNEQDVTYFTLLYGTNRNKMEDEIYNLDVATTDIKEVGKILSQYEDGLYLFISQMNTVDFTKDEMSSFADILMEYMPKNSHLSIGLFETVSINGNPPLTLDINDADMPVSSE